ncbi:TonB-dependent receptor [Pseudoduganella albidiflava]|uniref:TonB-dependent receptor n=1 Tax=Pseudoduganella albidiflava TaxID=321983 RepID=A0A411WRR1_9BURK|nr:TonB-dependent receptor [Pseudoduganella albidiflava]QBH99455.1 TonB-dependent receptor [Pseudoduganella albidiflava]GGY44968.1 TonB-dependent receptor [Pseudoduganella albidiflava]
MKLTPIGALVRALFLVPAAVATTSAAFAQQAPQPGQAAAGGDTAVQQVTVTGIRASVRSALSVKENSNSIVEVVSSEDIGKLPDTTIAESLARLPGLAAGLDRGNASQIVARGMGERFIGATLNGRELASSEPNRAVRFEQFPSESLSGAVVYKTQNADLIEGGVATSIDLQTVQPLKYKGRQLSVKADALFYPLANDVDAKAWRPRLGGIYIDQLAGGSVGVALAASYQKQPSIEKRKNHWAFNENNSVDMNGDGSVDRTPWGFEDEIKRGTNERASVLGKVEWKLSPDAHITADLYYAKNKIHEPSVQHWTGDIGNWDGWQTPNFSNLDIRDGYVVGATVRDVTVSTHSTRWFQNMSNFAGGLNGKFNVGDWKIDADVAVSRADRDSQWADVRQTSAPGTLSWAFTGNEHQEYSFTQDTGNAAIFGAPALYIDADGHVDDKLNSAQLSAWRPVELGPVSRIKFGARFSDREKSFHQTTWNLATTATALPASSFETIRAEGYFPALMLNDFDGTVGSLFGAGALSPDGRAQTTNDLLAGWRVKERSSAVYAQGDLDGEMFGLKYRGNVGLRVVHTKQTGYGMESRNGAAPTALEGGASYTKALPSANLILNLDEAQEHQLRFSLARAMSRAPMDEMRASRSLSIDTTPGSSQPLTGSAGNPGLLPMMANQADLSYQWYFEKGSLLSAGLFYKKVGSYIGITSDTTTIDGRQATITRSINGDGGYVRGLELAYQQAFTMLPAPFDGLGMSANFSYNESSIKEFTGDFPMVGLMRRNGGVTLWYEKNGFEARLQANYHSPFVRMPRWNAGYLVENAEETYVSANISKYLTPQLQLHLGLDNITNQRVIHKQGGNQYVQNVMEYGRRYNIGLAYKF